MAEAHIVALSWLEMVPIASVFEVLSKPFWSPTDVLVLWRRRDDSLRASLDFERFGSVGVVQARAGNHIAALRDFDGFVGADVCLPVGGLDAVDRKSVV